MSTLLISHEACFDHQTGPGHPERPERLRAVLEVLDGEEFSPLIRSKAPRATLEQIGRVHDAGYAEQLLAALPTDGPGQLDADTTVSPGSGEAALRAAGALCAAVDAVFTGQAGNAFCAVRPPGHHAEPAQAMGFCLFNNIAIGAQHARAAHGLERVAVVDFDVHHGNGTQAAFYNEPGLFFASTHQSQLYPGTGSANERGIDNNILNVPLAPFSGSGEFRSALERDILPALERFAPEMIFISAGFDAHVDDPLAQLSFTEDDYGWATQMLADMASRLCEGRLVSTLEGGYNLAALRSSTAAHVRALMAA